MLLTLGDRLPDWVSDCPRTNVDMDAWLPRVLMVIPGQPDARAKMPFARQQASALERLGVEVERFWLTSRSKPLEVAKASYRLRDRIREFRPDVVHAQYGTVTALVAALTTSVPLVITFRGSDLNPDPAVSPLYSLAQHTMSQLAALRAGKIICVSEQLKHKLIWRRGRVTVIPTGVDTTLFRPMPYEAARAQLGWSIEERVVLFNEGGTPVTKGAATAAAAVAVAERRVGKIRFEVMRGRYGPDDVRVLMNAADCLLLASRWEGSPTVVEEAIACNLPVISTNVGDVTERLRNVEPSWVRPRDPAALGAAIAEALRDRRRSNGQSVVGAISHDAIARRLVEIYCALARGARKDRRDPPNHAGAD